MSTGDKPKRGGKRQRSGRKQVHVATATMTAKQAMKSGIAAVSVAKELKERTETMLKAVDGSIGSIKQRSGLNKL